MPANKQTNKRGILISIGPHERVITYLDDTVNDVVFDVSRLEMTSMPRYRGAYYGRSAIQARFIEMPSSLQSGGLSDPAMIMLEAGTAARRDE